MGAGSVLYTAAAIVGTTAIGQLAGKIKELYKRVCLLHQKLFTALKYTTFSPVDLWPD